MKSCVKLIDSTLRDGAHILEPFLSPDLVREFCKVYEKAGLYGAEVGIGLGLGASARIPYDSLDLLRAARDVLKNTKLLSIIIPSIGGVQDIAPAASIGIDILRIAVYSTRPTDALHFIREAQRNGLETGVFLMSSHFVNTEQLTERAKMLESQGIDFLYIGDSSGAMTLENMAEKIHALTAALTIPVGAHAHNSLGLGVALPMLGLHCGCTYIDGTLEGLGEGGGNANLQALAALCLKQGLSDAIDLELLNWLAENKLRPLMPDPQELRAHHIMDGFCGKAPKVLLNRINP